MSDKTLFLYDWHSHRGAARLHKNMQIMRSISNGTFNIEGSANWGSFGKEVGVEELLWDEDFWYDGDKFFVVTGDSKYSYDALQTAVLTFTDMGLPTQKVINLHCGGKPPQNGIYSEITNVCTAPNGYLERLHVQSLFQTVDSLIQ